MHLSAFGAQASAKMGTYEAAATGDKNLEFAEVDIMPGRIRFHLFNASLKRCRDMQL
jgi:hypothetical protein